MTMLFSLEFFRNAFFVCLLLSILFSLISFFVVLRRMAFLGAGIAHTAFGGVAIGILFGIDPFFSTLIFCLFSALLIGKFTRYGNMSNDTAIGIFFSFSMALGALIIALRKKYTFDLSGYLFGNILGVTSKDLYLILGIELLFLCFLIFFFQKILFMTFEEDIACVSGVRTNFLDSVLLGFLAFIIVVSIKIVGIILVSALVVLPASFGLLFSKKYRRVILISIVYTLFIMIGGLFFSYQLNTPSGATMVVLGTLVFFVSLILKYIVQISIYQNR